MGWVGAINRKLFAGLLTLLPVSDQIGGYTVIVQRSQVTPAGISFEKAMRFVMTVSGLDLGNESALASTKVTE